MSNNSLRIRGQEIGVYVDGKPSRTIRKVRAFHSGPDSVWIDAYVERSSDIQSLSGSHVLVVGKSRENVGERFTIFETSGTNWNQPIVHSADRKAYVRVIHSQGVAPTTADIALMDITARGPDYINVNIDKVEVEAEDPDAFAFALTSKAQEKK